MDLTFHDIIYHKADGVARITINRPETYNAFTDITLRDMNAALEDAKTDRDVGGSSLRVVDATHFVPVVMYFGRPKAGWNASPFISMTAHWAVPQTGHRSGQWLRDRGRKSHGVPL